LLHFTVVDNAVLDYFAIGRRDNGVGRGVNGAGARLEGAVEEGCEVRIGMEVRFSDF